MGEVVVVSSCEEMEIEKVSKVDKLESKEGSSSMVRWESFLPKNGVRVLLVEADDSTRQIIGALLRKCNYKVATAPDGLKAWEVLKARPHNIDLILTEMELPSISGYALLTLIMEHEVCKNIPVIMMSKYDTVSMVYKCMTRGAADFLVKPIRINELKNLWQHVWRRQSVRRSGHGPLNDSSAQEKIEVTAENNAASDHSSGSRPRAPLQEECLKKGSDAQSSCGKLDVEAESANMTEVEEYSPPKQGLSPFPELTLQERPIRGHSGQNLSIPESAAADTAAYKGNKALDRQQRLEEQSQAENVDLLRLRITNPPRVAIDLIGAFDNHSKSHSYSNDATNKYDSSPHLDLSLTRCSPVVVENKISNETQMLNHSNASAFTRYVNKTLHTTFDPTPKDDGVYAGDHSSDNIAPESNSMNFFSVPLNLTSEAKHESRNISQTLFRIPLSKGGDGSSIPSPSPSSVALQSNACHQVSSTDIVSRNNYYLPDHSPRISSSEPTGRQEQKLESLQEQARLSSTDLCTSSSLCDDTARHLNGPEGSHDLSRQRSLIREAALNKFRLKRKERCFEKKVRYESRKKLAEQRPRVKGQFVRQVPPDPPPPQSDHCSGTSVAN